MKLTNAVESVKNFTTEFCKSEQFRRIIRNQQKGPNQLISNVLTSKPNLIVEISSITLCGLTIPLSELFFETLICLKNIIMMQKSRKTLFSEIITQIYSIKYFNFSLNTVIDANIRRAELVAVIVDEFQLNRLLTRQFVLKLKEENTQNYSLLTFFDILLV